MDVKVQYSTAYEYCTCRAAPSRQGARDRPAWLLLHGLAPLRAPARRPASPQPGRWRARGGDGRRAPAQGHSSTAAAAAAVAYTVAGHWGMVFTSDTVA